MSFLDGTGGGMTPDTAWVLGASAVALITTGPAYISARRSRTAAREEGALTRDAVESAIGRLNGRIDELGEGLRSDIAEVRDWQAEHATDHAIAALRNTAPHSRRLEYRDKE